MANSEAGDNSLRKKLLAFWTPYILPYTPGALPIGEKKFRRFFLKNLRVKNESRHQLFRVHRVYGIQNDRLDLTVNKFFMVWKTMLPSQIYSVKCKMKNPWKSRHLLFEVHRGYGIQNDRLDHTNNKFLTFWKAMHRSLRYFQIFGFFCLTFLWISLARVQRFKNHRKLVNREIKTFLLNNH